MREFLFRGKDRHGAWHYGAHRKLPNGFAIIYNNDGGTTEVDPDTVGEYIGLNDRTGRRIFEGDIVKVTSPDPATGETTMAFYATVWQLSGFRLVQQNGMCENFYWSHINEYSVIGNIHDNPELMEAE